MCTYNNTLATGEDTQEERMEEFVDSRNFFLSTIDNHDFYMANSNIMYHKTASSYSSQGDSNPNHLYFESVSNASPTCTIATNSEDEETDDDETQSMVTYKTNYAFREGEPEQQQQSQPQQTKQDQSTPYFNDNLAKVRKLRNSDTISNRITMRKSLTVNFDQMIRQMNQEDEEQQQQTNNDGDKEAEARNNGKVIGLNLNENKCTEMLRNSKKCRRSNTTYTVAGGNRQHSKIIDYFTR